MKSRLKGADDVGIGWRAGYADGLVRSEANKDSRWAVLKTQRGNIEQGFAMKDLTWHVGRLMAVALIAC